MKRLYVLFIGGLFIITACVQPASNIGTPADDTMMSDDSSMSETDDGMMEGDGEAMEGDDEMTTDDAAPAAEGMTTFTNKAANYSVTYPDTWYWRHFIASEVPDPTIIDYFAADPDVAPALSNEYLGRYVVTVSNRPVTDLSSDLLDALVNTQQRSGTIDGSSATRITGQYYAGELDGFTTVQYIFNRFGRAHQVVMTAFQPTTADIEAFEAFASSLTFSN